MSELKPCPFCGSEAGTYKFILPGEIVWLAYCPNENCHFSHRTASLAAWNARPIEDALNERIAELEAFIDQLIEAGESMSLAVECENQIEANAYYSWKELVKDWKEG